MLLTISNDQKEIVMQLVIGDVNPQQATVAIIQALDALPPPPKPRATRSDAGTTRKPSAQ